MSQVNQTIFPASFSCADGKCSIHIDVDGRAHSIELHDRDATRLLALLLPTLDVQTLRTIETAIYRLIEKRTTLEFRRLTLDEMKALKVGDKIHCRYTDFGDEEGSGPRTDCEHAVVEITDKGMSTQDLPHKSTVWDWDWDEWDEECQSFDCCGQGEGVVMAKRLPA